MISALLLGNAGVDPLVVGADYATSVNAMAHITKHAPDAEPDEARSPAEIDEWVRDKLPIVHATAARAHEIFDLLGVSIATRAALRRLLIAE